MIFNTACTYSLIRYNVIRRLLYYIIIGLDPVGPAQQTGKLVLQASLSGPPASFDCRTPCLHQWRVHP